MAAETAAFDLEDTPGLEGARTVDEVLRRSGSDEVVGLLRRLGFWTTDIDRRTAQTVRAFPVRFSDLRDLEGDNLGDLLAYWSSEVARAGEMIAALEGEKARLTLRLDRIRAQAGLEILREARGADEKITTRELEMRVAVDQRVQAAEDRLSPVEAALRALKEIRSAAEVRAQAVSREITRRGDLMKAGIDRR